MSESDTYALLELHDELDELEAYFQFRSLRRKVPVAVLSITLGWAVWVLTPPEYHLGAAMMLIPYFAALLAGPIARLVRMRRIREELETVDADAIEEGAAQRDEARSVQAGS